jgi:hypothetical protein
MRSLLAYGGLCVALLAAEAGAAVTTKLKRALAPVPQAWTKLELERALSIIDEAKPLAKGPEDEALCDAYEGLVLRTMGKLDEGADALRKALALNPGVAPPGKVPPKFQAAFDAGITAAKSSPPPQEAAPAGTPEAMAPPEAAAPAAPSSSGTPVPTEPKIAVVELQASGAAPSTASSLTLLLPSELRRVLPHAHITSGRELTDLLGFERTKELMACGDSASSCMSEIGQALGVDELVSGSVGRLGTTYIIELRRLDVRRGRPIATVAETAQSEREDVLVGALRVAVRKLYGLAAADQGVGVSTSVTSPRRPWHYGLAIGGGVLVAGGAVVGVLTGVDYSNTQSRANGGVPPSAADKSRIQLEGRLADGLVVVGAVLTAVGGWFLLTRDGSVSMAPTADRGSLGWALSGRF